jgi:hypothetical protein
MAGQKFLAWVSDKMKEIAGIQTSAGAGDAGKIPALDSSGRLDSSMMPTGFGSETKTIVAFENLVAGDFVNIFNDTGTLKVRKADASGGFAKRAHGFVLAAVSAAANATVYYGNLNNQVSGLTIGSTYFLSGTTAGAVTLTPPSTAGYIVQELGRATVATEMLVEIQQPIELS